MVAINSTSISIVPIIRRDMAAASLEVSRLFFKVQSKVSAFVLELVVILS